jgi:hypothetical protein
MTKKEETMNKVNNLDDPILYYDVYFKALFAENEDLLFKLISCITNIKFDKRKKYEVIYNEIPVERENEKFKKCDFVVKVSDDLIVNVELNKSGKGDWKNKSLSYIFKVYTIHTKRGKKYYDVKTYQVNLNAFKSDEEPVIGYSLKPTIIGNGYDEIKEVNNNLPNFTDNFLIYTYNIYKGNEIYYNYYVNKEKGKIPDYVRWAAFLSLKDFSKVPEVMKGIFNESECKKVMDKMKELESDSDLLSVAEIQDIYEQSYDRGLYKAEQEGLKRGEEIGLKRGEELGLKRGEELGLKRGEELGLKRGEELGLKRGEELGLKRGEELGLKQGEELGIVKTIKSMLKNQANYDFISKVTGKNQEEIRKIEQSMNLG